MWESVLLEEDLTLGLLKSAIRSGHFTLIRPETEDEKPQIDAVVGRINRSKTARDALMYCLLADCVYMDGIGWDVFENLEVNDPEAVTSRPLIESVAPELQGFMNPTDSLNNNFVKCYNRSDQELANMFSAAEPLMWKSFKKAGIDRETLRFALDVFLIAPELISVRVHSAGTTSEFDSELLAKAEELIGRKLSGNERRYIESVAYIAVTKGYVAVSKLTEANERNAVYPVMELTTGRDRRQDVPVYFGAQKSSALIAATKVFLDEIEYWPLVRDINDLMRIRSAQAFLQFRETLRHWVEVTVRGDPAEQLAIRREIKKANAALRRSATCGKIGRWFTYLGLPVMALDALTLPIFGASLTVAGFGLQALADVLHRKGSWIIVGK